MPEKDWKWFGIPGHFCGAWECQFRMCTQVGDYLVSTIGEYQPGGVDGEFKIVGLGRLYETMIFPVTDEICEDKTCGCDMPIIELYEIECLGANTRGEAQRNHMSMCHRMDKEN